MSALEVLGAAAPLLSLAGLLVGLRLGRKPKNGDRLRAPKDGGPLR